MEEASLSLSRGHLYSTHIYDTSPMMRPTIDKRFELVEVLDLD